MASGAVQIKTMVFNIRRAAVRFFAMRTVLFVLSVVKEVALNQILKPSQTNSAHICRSYWHYQLIQDNRSTTFEKSRWGSFGQCLAAVETWSYWGSVNNLSHAAVWRLQWQQHYQHWWTLSRPKKSQEWHKGFSPLLTHFGKNSIKLRGEPRPEAQGRALLHPHIHTHWHTQAQLVLSICVQLTLAL